MGRKLRAHGSHKWISGWHNSRDLEGMLVRSRSWANIPHCPWHHLPGSSPSILTAPAGEMHSPCPPITGSITLPSSNPGERTVGCTHRDRPEVCFISEEAIDRLLDYHWTEWLWNKSHGLGRCHLQRKAPLLGSQVAGSSGARERHTFAPMALQHPQEI